MTQYVAATVLFFGFCFFLRAVPDDVATNSHRSGLRGVSCLYFPFLINTTFVLCTTRPFLVHSQHLSLTSKPKSIQLDQSTADAGGHTPLHSHNGPRHNWGPRNRQHSRSFREAGGSQVYPQHRFSLFACTQ